MQRILKELTIINNNYTTSIYDLIHDYDSETSAKLTELETKQTTSLNELNELPMLYNDISEQHDKQIKEYISKLDSLEKNNIELKQELENFNNVSLLKKLHIKLDKLTNENSVLTQKINKLTNENSVLTQKIKTTKKTTNEICQELLNEPLKKYISLEIKSDHIPETLSNDNQIIPVDNVNTNETEDNNDEVSDNAEDSDDEEVTLKKINKRYYYITETEPIKVYKALKISKGNYDIGKYMGIFVNDKIIKNKENN
tara:strand:+ start:16833 stop:17600 length:768 start_codon:yes stop_codon:yes gene_type:complete